MKRRTNQGGSVATFIVIGVILATGLVGSIYLLNQRVGQVRKEQTIAANKKKQPTTTIQKSSESNKTTAKTSTSTNKTSVSVPKAPTNAPDIPATGPELSAGDLMGVYLLSAVTTGYILSRRKLAKYSL